MASSRHRPGAAVLGVLAAAAGCVQPLPGDGVPSPGTPGHDASPETMADRALDAGQLLDAMPPRDLVQETRPLDAGGPVDAPPGTGPWVQRGQHPVARARHGVTYAGRGKVMIYGGADVYGMLLDDVWEWDGATGSWWRSPSPLPPTPWPPARTYVAAAYDAARSKVMIFGGLAGNHLDDTWEWDGASATWANRAPGMRPSPRNQTQMAYDERRGKVVLFSGNGAGELRDTWEWDGAAGAWVDRTPSPLPASWPAARVDSAMAYDGVRGQVVMFGASADRRMWAWDGAAGRWLDLTPSTIPREWPATTWGHAMAYDARRRRVVLHGGNQALGDGGIPNEGRETWEWDGATGTWSNRTPDPINAFTWPSQRVITHALAFDPTRARVVMFGGWQGPGVVHGDLWEWDGSK